jgi:uncharacterized protein (DUF39 family)
MVAATGCVPWCIPISSSTNFVISHVVYADFLIGSVGGGLLRGELGFGKTSSAKAAAKKTACQKRPTTLTELPRFCLFAPRSCYETTRMATVIAKPR